VEGEDEVRREVISEERPLGDGGDAVMKDAGGGGGCGWRVRSFPFL
jgi:hypothetical protein